MHTLRYPLVVTAAVGALFSVASAPLAHADADEETDPANAYICTTVTIDKKTSTATGTGQCKPNHDHLPTEGTVNGMFEIRSKDGKVVAACTGVRENDESVYGTAKLPKSVKGKGCEARSLRHDELTLIPEP